MNMVLQIKSKIFLKLIIVDFANSLFKILFIIYFIEDPVSFTQKKKSKQENGLQSTKKEVKISNDIPLA